MAKNRNIRIGLVFEMMDRLTARLKKMDAAVERLEKPHKVPVEAVDKVSRQAERMQRALKKLEKPRAIAVSVKDHASGALNRITTTAGRLKNALFSLPGMIGIGLGGAGLIGGVKAILDASSFEEQAKTGLEVMLRSKEAADDVFDKAKKFADVTPFLTKEVIASTGSLISSRFSTDKIFSGLLRDVGDLAAANQDVGASITDVARVFGRLKAGDSGEAFERLRDFKIARQDLMEEGLKFSKGGQFEGTAEQAISAVQRIIQRRFGGMMEKQSKTWAGLWSTFQSSATNTLAAVGKYEVEKNTTVLDLFKRRLDQTTRLIINKDGELTPLAERFVKRIGEGFDWVDKKIQSALDSAQRMFDREEFKGLDFWGKVNLVLDDLSEQIGDWLDGGGREALDKVGAEIGRIMGRAAVGAFKGMMTVVPGVALEANKQVVENPRSGAAWGTAAAVNLGLLWAGSKLLGGPIAAGKKAWDWGKAAKAGLLPGAGATAGAGAAAARTGLAGGVLRTLGPFGLGVAAMDIFERASARMSTLPVRRKLQAEGLSKEETEHLVNTMFRPSLFGSPFRWQTKGQYSEPTSPVPVKIDEASLPTPEVNQEINVSVTVHAKAEATDQLADKVAAKVASKVGAVLENRSRTYRFRFG